MERKILYRNQTEIDNTLSAYSKAIRPIQAALDSLTSEGITLTNDTMYDLFDGGNKTRESVEKQIRSEVGKFKFMISKNEHLKTLRPLLSLVDNAVEEVRKARNQYSGAYVYNCEKEYFICKDLKISLSPDAKQLIEDKYTLYADQDPIAVEVLERAEKLRDELNEFNRFLRERGELVYPLFGDMAAYPFITSILHTGVQQGQYCVSVNEEALRAIHSPLPKMP